MPNRFDSVNTVLSLCLALALSCLCGCTRNEIVADPAEPAGSYTIQAHQYSLKHYFVDTSYIRLYEQYYQNDRPLVDPSARIVKAEVWMTRVGTSYDGTERVAAAWLNLPPRPPSGYDSIYRTYPPVDGEVEVQLFYPLKPWDFSLAADGYVGVISLARTVPDFVTIGVAYRRADARQSGEFPGDSTAPRHPTRLVLKLLKPCNLFSIGPRYEIPWKMLLKNVYEIHPGHVSRHEFVLDVVRLNQRNTYDRSVQGHPFLRVMGFDSYGADGMILPDGDGAFDWRPGLTVLQSSGEVIFPSLRPFDAGMKQYFQRRGLPLPDNEYFFPDLYDSSRAAVERDGKNRYSLRGKGIFD